MHRAHTGIDGQKKLHTDLIFSIPGAGKAETCTAFYAVRNKNRLAMSRRLRNSQSTFLVHTSTQNNCAFKIDPFSVRDISMTKQGTLSSPPTWTCCALPDDENFLSMYSSQRDTEQVGALLQIGKPRSQELATTICDQRTRRQGRSAGVAYSFTGAVAAHTAELGETHSINGTCPA